MDVYAPATQMTLGNLNEEARAPGRLFDNIKTPEPINISSSPTSLTPWSNGSFGDDSPFADSPYEGPMAGSLPLDGAFGSNKVSPCLLAQSNIPMKNKMSDLTLPETIDECVEICDKTD